MELPALATHQDQMASPSSTSIPPPIGLTAFHVAVINNDRDKARALLASRDHAVDERTSTGATALMLACLFGRSNMFSYLLHKSASLWKKDHKGFGCEDYVKHLAFTKPLLGSYKIAAFEQPRRSGRKVIYEFLQPLSSIIKQGKVETPQVPPTPFGEQSERRVDFFRKGGIFEIVETRRLALVEWPLDLGRKTCGAVRSSNEIGYRAIAISGWRGDEAEQAINVVEVLNNAIYLRLIRDFAKIVGFEFKKMYLDTAYPGSPSEKAGAFHACHAEKQLAIFVLRESIAHILGMKEIDINLENIAKLKLAVDGKSEGLQANFIIELQHKPCYCCLDFLDTIQEKSGLRFRWVQRDWFFEGKRSKLYPNSDVFEEKINRMADDVDDDYILSEAPKPRPTASDKPQHKMPKKAGSKVGKEDWLFPRNVSRRMNLTSSQKRRQKQKLRQKANANGHLPSISDTPSTTESSSSLVTKDRITPINFEIPIRVVNTPIIREAAARESTNQEPVDQDSIDQDSADQDPVDQDSVNQDYVARQPFPDLSKFMFEWGVPGRQKK